MAEKKLPATERMYQILVRPVVTEKSTGASAHNAYMFEVSGDATKPEIRQAVETLYKVKVEKVNTLVRKGKNKGRRFGGTMGRRSDRKMAFIQVKEGQMLDVSAGI